MSLTTEQRLASTREMRRPRIIQLLDMSETSHQKVAFSCLFPCSLMRHLKRVCACDRLASSFSKYLGDGVLLSFQTAGVVESLLLGEKRNIIPW